DAAGKPRAARKRVPKMAPSPGAGEPASRPSDTEPGGARAYRITLTPGPDTLRRGINPLGTFDELGELGPTRIETDPEAVPALDELDPERSYLSWTIFLETTADLDRIREVFLFFNEDSTVSIEVRAADGGWVPAIEEAPAATTFPPPATAAVVPDRN